MHSTCSTCTRATKFSISAAAPVITPRSWPSSPARKRKIIAVEIDEGLAARAADALAPWPQVTVVHGDGALGPFEPSDIIVVSAGATHPLPAWLAALKPEGKLLFPLTSTRGPGTMAYITRKNANLFAASLNGSVFFVDFAGARDSSVSNELAMALKRDKGAAVRSLRCDLHMKGRVLLAARRRLVLFALRGNRRRRLVRKLTARAPATCPCASADCSQSPRAGPRPQCARRLRRPPDPDRSPSRRS